MNNLKHLSFGQLPAVRIKADDGAQAIVTLFGAHVVSWIPAGATEQLFCSTRSALDGSKAIRGGIPVIFPQFAERGNGMRHGFARLSHWHLVDSGAEDGAHFAEFSLDSGDKLAAPWPHDFSLLFRVAVCADRLDLSLQVRNTGQSALSFSAALHTYHAVAELTSVNIEGLQHTDFLDQTSPVKATGKQTERLLTCTGSLDRIYSAVPTEIRLRAGDKELLLSEEGFGDAVVWNPGPSPALADLAEDEWQRFICIEPARIAPCELPAGGEWLGRHRIRHSRA